MLTIDKQKCKELMLRMMKVRRVEEAIRRLYEKGAVHGTLHLCIGEEAADVGSTAVLKNEDLVYATHRGHGICIGKGVDEKKLIAEILGKSAGTNRGRGGSMHISDLDHGVVGCDGIVGANAPLACGAALALKSKKVPDRVVVCFTGDGAMNTGAVMESMNLAGIWKLPIIFVLVENHYAVSTLVGRASANPDFTQRAAAFGLNCFETDGNDVLAVTETMEKARASVLEEQKPCLVIEHTYRIAGHSRSDKNKYRTEEEIEYWNQRGPIIRFRDKLIAEGMFTAGEIEELAVQARQETDRAVEYALAQPAADDSISDLVRSVYAE